MYDLLQLVFPGGRRKSARSGACFLRWICYYTYAEQHFTTAGWDLDDLSDLSDLSDV